jgi:hypothetical protein
VPRTLSATHDPEVGLLASMAVDAAASEVKVWDWRSLKCVHTFELLGKRFNVIAMLTEDLIVIGTGYARGFAFNAPHSCHLMHRLYVYACALDRVPSLYTASAEGQSCSSQAAVTRSTRC